jgi:two-component system, NarL family, invasion response regulator UvrY
MRVLLADDHPIVRHGVGQLLRQEHPQAQIDEAGSAREALDHAAATLYDLAILDLSLPDSSGLDCLAALQRLQPAMPVLVLSLFAESEFASRAIAAGACGYLPKHAAGKDLIKAANKILAGGVYVSEAYAEQLAFWGTRRASAVPHEQLSTAEFRVMRELASGKSVSEIAAELSRSVKTISSQRVNVLKKLNLRHNAALTLYCVKHGLVE